MNRKKRKLDPEEQEELNRQYVTIAELLIKIIGETTHSRLLRALLVGAIAAAAEAVTGNQELPKGIIPEPTGSAPAVLPPAPVIATPSP